MTIIKRVITSLLLFLSAALTGQSQTNTVTDIDGNTYSTIIIGDQEWMDENLRTTRYQNGDELLYDQPFNIWQVSKEGIWAYYDDNPDNESIYGKLYNWYAANDERNICPVGWRIPADADWQQLVEFVDPNEWGNNNTLGTKLKSRRQVDSPLGSPWDTNEHPRWDSHGKRYGTDNFGFNALPAGIKTLGDTYIHKGKFAYYWSSTLHNDTHAWARVLYFSHRGMSNTAYPKKAGMSVRCVKEVEVQSLVPEVTTNIVSQITPYTAISGGEIISEGSSDVIHKGIVWGISENPTLENNNGISLSDEISFDFISKASCLNVETTYYIRAFATNNVGVGYGESVQFTTIELNSNGLVYDIDGNSYETAVIGNQEWLNKNLATSRYNNCDSIYNFIEVEVGDSSTDGLYAVYPYNDLDGLNSENDVIETYGALYNWHALNDERGVCPVGWETPNIFEITALISYLDGYENAGGKLKSELTEPSDHPRWDNPNVSASNSYGFSGLPAGLYSSNNNQFSDVGEKLYLRSATETASDSGFSFTIELTNSGAAINTNPSSKDYGFSIRCFRQIDGEASLPEVTTLPVTNITTTTISSGSDVVSDGGAPVGSRGLVWSKSGNPTLDENDGWVGGNGTGVDLRDITNLDAGTTYYIRAHATNIAGTSYGEVIEFTTLNEEVNNSTFDFIIETTAEQTEFSFVVDNAIEFHVEWEDGDTDTYNGNSTPTHDFGEAGLWTIKVRGEASRIAFFNSENPAHAKMLKDITNPISNGVTGITSSVEMFRNTDVESFTSENFFDDISPNITNMSGMFWDSKFNQEIGQWNVSNVSDMNNMFRQSVFNQDISQWDVGNVTSMGYMFDQSNSFNQPIGNWDVGSVTNMREMFRGNLNNPNPFNQDIGAWDVGSVENMSGMFAYSIFNQPIGEWNVSNVINMSAMFRKSLFNQEIGDWDVSNVFNMLGMFDEAINFNQEIGDWDVSNVTNMSAMFSGAINFNQDIGNWDVSNVISMNSMFMGSGFNMPISNWNVSKVNDMQAMFWSTPFNQDIGGWDVSKVTNMDGMFSNSSFNQDISGWNVGSVTMMSVMFQGTPFNQDISSWDVSQVTDMQAMFNVAISFNQDLGSWDVSKVTNMGTMFAGTAFNQDISGWDVSNVTDMSHMFSGATFFNQDLSGWDVSNVTDMNRMFSGATFFNQDISSWDVSNVTDMGGMFLRSDFNQDIGSWDVSQVTDMSLMFYYSGFDRDVSDWEVSMVENFNDFLKGTTMSTEYYNNLLKKWSLLLLKPNLNFNAGLSQYDLGLPEVRRQYIIDTFGWNIFDGGTTGEQYQE